MSDEVTRIATLFIVLLISLVFHEVAHGFVANRLGDRTAAQMGLVTLNPFPHMRREPFGTTILPLLMLYSTGGTSMMGFAHVPIDAEWADRNPGKSAAVAAAGPLTNGLLAVLAFVGLYLLVQNDVALGYPTSGFMFVTPMNTDDGTAVAGIQILSTFLFLNVLLMVFNLMPWPPLDAHLILGGLFPKTLRPLFRAVARQPMFMLVGIVVLIFYVLPEIYWPIIGWIGDQF